MNLFRHKAIAVVAATFGVVAILGGTLGVATAATRGPLTEGFNYVGGPFFGDVEPENFVQCLPTTSWTAIYIWDAEKQEWEHYFNEAQGIPAYVNRSAVGGIDQIPQLAGVALLMEQSHSTFEVPEDPGAVVC